ncbi:MAG: tripartite tricarboxylate transporter substrate-binding protein [Paracoccus sp. (in: a-proteobacteria)]|uniref:Bug family tripartite tricarboxylate transporter substrate binding protein n=1 Tax=Paracoccus sp. TaxID=267 RepID=UPI0026E0F3BD|nr:tripartite tricarboxylate transporter substrate-binding protein [Paracoccus sp. (in: a-proteobacteria)]MDO5633062.1 tripartite tricarboxylate transporter substrate-binding protein [Paracoccus sp. (in: a-proteobacteria)]
MTGVVTAAALAAAPGFAFEPKQPACIAPSGAGGGWDFTCRHVGKTLQDLGLIHGTMQVTNREGGGGGVAFSEVVTKRNGENDLIVAASSATTTRLAQGAYPGNTMDQVRWLGTVGADYGVIGVAANSPINTLPELMEQVKADPRAIAFAGGSAVGGWDHLKVLMTAEKAGVEDVRQVKYVAFMGGGEAITQLMAGSVQAFTGDISEAQGFVESGDLKVLAVLSPERLPGKAADIPTAREQGLDVIGANWRGFYAPGGMSDDAYAFWVDALKTMYASDDWKTVMETNGLADFDYSGEAFQNFVAGNVAEIEALSRKIGIIQ